MHATGSSISGVEPNLQAKVPYGKIVLLGEIREDPTEPGG
jgi:hypothetical protein